MSTHPRVSVIMNCRNSAEFLAEAIDSVFAQTYQDWEIVFWDNQSDDGSPEIAKRYLGKLRYFRSAEFLPLGAARNAAIAQARGEYIGLLDCDDVWSPDKLEKQVPLLDEDPSVGLGFADCYMMNGRGEVSGTFFGRVGMPPDDVLVGLLTRPNFIPCLTALMRRVVVQKCGGFNPELRYCEEYDLFARIALAHKIVHCKEALASCRYHDGSETSKASHQMTREAIDVIEQVWATHAAPLYRSRWGIRKRLLGLRCKMFVQQLSRYVTGRRAS